MSFSGAVLTRTGFVRGKPPDRSYVIVGKRPDEKAAAAMKRYAWRGDAGGGAAVRNAHWQWRSLTRGAAESFAQFRIEQEFFSAGKTSRNGQRESRVAGETRFVPLKPGAFWGPR
jgi:hypothetical protein